MADVQIKCVSFHPSVQKALRSMERERCQTPRAAPHWPVGAHLSTRSNILRCHEAFLERHSRCCIAISCSPQEFYDNAILSSRPVEMFTKVYFNVSFSGSESFCLIAPMFLKIFQRDLTRELLQLFKRFFYTRSDIFFLMQPFPNSKKFEGGHTTVWTEKQSQEKNKQTFMHWCAPFWIWGRIEVLLPHSTRSHGHTCTSNTAKRVKEIHTCDLVIVCLQRCFHVS